MVCSASRRHSAGRAARRRALSAPAGPAAAITRIAVRLSRRVAERGSRMIGPPPCRDESQFAAAAAGGNDSLRKERGNFAYNGETVPRERVGAGLMALCIAVNDPDDV